MDVALVGAAGVCGRQLLFQMLAQNILPASGRLQLVGHRGGDSESTLWGLRSDAVAAFDESAPPMDIVLDPHEVQADLVLMMAGATVPTDPGASIDRVALAEQNRAIFEEYAEALARCAHPPTVVIQSNPVEMAVGVFAAHWPRHRVLGAAGLSDTGRFGREVARDLGRRRADVQALVVGQHGDHLVPLWSQLSVRGVDQSRLTEYISTVRAGRSLADLPDEIRAGKSQMVALVRRGDIAGAYEYVNSLPADVRCGVKPFFTHFTAGRTTEATTAHAAGWITRQIILGVPVMLSCQVSLAGDWLGRHGLAAAPVILSPSGWSRSVAMELADDELALLDRALAAAEG